MNITERSRSIKKLKAAVKNKTLACYNPKVTQCLYYHGETETCCAVGILVPVLQMVKHIDSKGNCKGLCYSSDISQPIGYIMKTRDEMFGLTKYELSKLQELHDLAVGGFDEIKLRNFEKYVLKLKVNT